MTSSTDSFTTTDVRTASWDVAAGATARGTLVLLTGRGEHPGAYARFGKRIAFDGYRVHVVDTADQDAAATLASALLASSDSAKPRVLAGSDTGAALALSLASGAAEADAVVLAALPLGGAASALADDEVRSACPLHRQVLAQEENLDAGALAAGLAPAAVPRAEDIPVPVLAFHGEEDAVVPVGAARTWAAGLPHGTLVTTAGGLRDAFNDKQHRSVAARIVLFLEELGTGPTVLVEN
ncbi:hypothetical protein GCM10023081_42720 [Arthrobacter ginkgonis]|uniref:Lysophospholipase n=1 Tax=Arthrobacter ginkgonis TaxID=1630594 RepID=A0ABP7DAS7_9MICC